MEFSDLPEELSGALLKLVGATSRGREAFARMRTQVLPTWTECEEPVDAIKASRRLGKACGEHVSACRLISCNYHKFIKAEWTTPDTYRDALRLQFDATLGGAPQDVTAEANAIIEMWVNRPDQDVACDPRYRAFQIGFDWVLLQAAVLRDATVAPRL